MSKSIECFLKSDTKNKKELGEIIQINNNIKTIFDAS